MELNNLLTPECIVANLKATSKKQALQEISKRIAEVTGENERDIFDVIIEREKLGTTGVGDGIAIPHGKLETLKKLYGFFARLERPVNFDSVDERPVDLIFLLLAPEAAGAEHLKALACVSRFLRDKANCDKLRGSTNPEALYAILIGNEKHQAA
jgi:PTS system nitrogen regulatory IIA component